MWSPPSARNLSGAGEHASSNYTAKAESGASPNLNRTCCGQTIEPHLAEARDRSGNVFFATVWYCTRCGRVML